MRSGWNSINAFSTKEQFTYCIEGPGVIHVHLCVILYHCLLFIFQHFITFCNLYTLIEGEGHIVWTRCRRVIHVCSVIVFILLSLYICDAVTGESDTWLFYIVCRSILIFGWHMQLFCHPQNSSVDYIVHVIANLYWKQMLTKK